MHFLPSRMSDNLAQSLRETIKWYQCRGFRVQSPLMDSEFEKVKAHLLEVVVNTTSAGEHVGDVEWHIKTIKEWGQGIVNTLPFKQMPARMMVELIHFCTMWLTTIPSKNREQSVQQTLTQGNIIRQGVNYKRQCCVPFGAYCEVFEDQEQTNTMASCTWGAISLGPTGNLQGTHKFFYLTTGRVTKQRQFTKLPMPKWIIRRVEDWEGNECIGDLLFLDHTRAPFPWNRDYNAEATGQNRDRGAESSLKVQLAESMGQVELTLYQKYISTDNKGQPVLYVQLHSAIFGLLKCMLFFYWKLKGQLGENGFKINPYDPCIANKWVNGAQLTVTWHVDDLKVIAQGPTMH